jgi:hypothetical protein
MSLPDIVNYLMLSVVSQRFRSMPLVKYKSDRLTSGESQPATRKTPQAIVDICSSGFHLAFGIGTFG